MDLIVLVVPLVLIALLGIPHGALDGYVIKSVSRNTRDSIVFFACYVLLAAMSIGSWLLDPTAAMLGFLAISVLHFGRSDVAKQPYARPLLAILARGGLWVIALPIIQWHTAESMFAHLQTDTEQVHGALSIAMVPWVVGSMAHLLAEFRHGHRRVCSEWLIGLLTVLLLPVLWAFCVYFCGWHARRHMARVLICSADAKQASRYMLAFTALTLSIAASLYLLFLQQVEIESAVLTLFFVGLFAVTVPHMILIDYCLPRWQAHWRIKS